MFICICMNYIYLFSYLMTHLFNLFIFKFTCLCIYFCILALYIFLTIYFCICFFFFTFVYISCSSIYCSYRIELKDWKQMCHLRPSIVAVGMVWEFTDRLCEHGGKLIPTAALCFSCSSCLWFTCLSGGTQHQRTLTKISFRKHAVWQASSCSNQETSCKLDLL